MEMLLDLDKIPRLHNILAAFSTWVLLAGYLVFPATFNSLRQNQKLDQQLDSGLEAQILKQVKNAPLLYVAAIACGIGVGGCLWIWLQHRKNYIWVINRIFLPVFMNSLAGLISTLVNVYSAQQGQYSITAKVTVTVTGACTAVAAGLFLLYNNLALEKVKKKHRFETEVYQREVERWGDIAEPAPADQTEAKSAGFLTRWMSKVKKPGVDPESVV
jgi:drug/metabolite transporter superfamily protein YnfA